MRPTSLDLIYLVLIVAAPVAFELRGGVARMKAKIAAGVPNVRRKTYLRTIAFQFALALPVVIGWIVTRRPWSALAIVPPTSTLHATASAVIIAATVAFGAAQLISIRKLAASDEKKASYRAALAHVEFMMPRDRGEFRLFGTLSVIAGVCEEFLFRGYMMWVLVAYMSFPLAVLVSAALFGLAHIYQGRRQAAKIGVIAVLMNIVVWLGGWLVPAMVLHAVFNAATGRLAYVVLRGAQAETDDAAV